MRKKIFLILAILWMAIIFSFSAKDADESTKESNAVGMFLGSIVYSDFEEWTEEEQQAFAETWDHPVRKCAHMTEYAILGFFLVGAGYDGRENCRRAMGRAFRIAALYAATDEIHQYFVPGRACMLTDVGYDALGALVGVLLGSVCFIVSEKVFSHTTKPSGRMP